MSNLPPKSTLGHLYAKEVPAIPIDPRDNSYVHHDEKLYKVFGFQVADDPSLGLVVREVTERIKEQYNTRLLVSIARNGAITVLSVDS